MKLSNFLKVAEGHVLVHAYNKYGVDEGICHEPKGKFKRYWKWDVFKVEPYNNTLFVYVRELN
jgi:hypothetical protein